MPTTSTFPLTPKLPVTFVFANNSILPVPTVLTSKLLFVAVVSILLPTICMSSVRNGPPTISPVTYKVPPTVNVSLAVIGPDNVVVPFTTKLPKVAVPVTVSLPVTVRVKPLKVKFALSINLPLVLAYVTRPLVKSVTCACASVDNPLTPKLPVTFVFANNSIEPVPTVLTSKLLFVAVVSILLPTI